MLYQMRTGRASEPSINWLICAGVASPKSPRSRACHALRTRSGSEVDTIMKLGRHGERASGAPEEEMIRDSRADTSLASSAVSPATRRQIGKFQRTSESSSDDPG